MLNSTLTSDILTLSIKCLSDSESDEEGDEESHIIRCLRPCPAPEAMLTAKRDRYASWNKDPSALHSDCEKQMNSILGTKRDLAALYDLEERY